MRCRLLNLLTVAFVLAGPLPAAQAQGQSGARAFLLDVPYVTQTPELCGGAAVAMVLRYWGEREVFPQDFASLVVASERGIPTGALVSAVRDRRWQAVIVPADAGTAHARIRAEMDQRRPLIALIEVGPATYHYVVIVGATDEAVVVHDPAQAPFQVWRWAAFDRAWAAAGRWLMLVLPGDGVRSSARMDAVDAPTGMAGTVTPCEALVERGITLALEGRPEGKGDEAEEALVAATRLCPVHPAAWRELAGLRFSQSRWAEAEVLAATALRLEPDDAHARRLVATSRYLMGDETGALKAWTPLGEPRIETLDIHGAGRTRHPVVVRAMGLLPRQVLTAEAYGRALRRLDELPVLSTARLHYEPLDGGLARVDAFVAERDLVPRGWLSLGSLGTRVLVSHELRVEVAGALGAGERAMASWRWTSARPRVMLSLAMPAPASIPGVVSLTAVWDRQSYQAPRESRRRTGLSIADWATSRFRWNGGVALDRFDGRSHVAADAGLEVRLATDHLAIGATAAAWAPFEGRDRFATVGLHAAWRSTADRATPSWTSRIAVDGASRLSPLAVWEGAGTGQARDGLLRAHPLLKNDVLTGEVFGRSVAHGTVEYAHPIAGVVTARLLLAAFVDVARAWHRMDGAGRSPVYADAGVGLRVFASGRPDFMRIDLAHGFRGGGTRVSVTWGRGWSR